MAAELNGVCALKVPQVAVSSNNGFAKLNRYLGDAETNDGMNFIFGDAGEGDPSRVKTVRIDDFCDEYGIDRVDLLKVDVQGHEFEVFKGAERLLRDGRIASIFFELSWADDPGADCSACQSLSLLEQCGYLFSSVGQVEWRPPGEWMYKLNGALARKAVGS